MKWEYSAYVITDKECRENPQAILDKIQRYGEFEWELIAAFALKGGQQLYFKRPKYA